MSLFYLIFLGLNHHCQICFSLMPYPCSDFYFDIKFDDRLYPKDKSWASTFLFWIQSVAKFDTKVKVTNLQG